MAATEYLDVMMHVLNTLEELGSKHAAQYRPPLLAHLQSCSTTWQLIMADPLLKNGAVVQRVVKFLSTAGGLRGGGGMSDEVRKGLSTMDLQVFVNMRFSTAQHGVVLVDMDGMAYSKTKEGQISRLVQVVKVILDALISRPLGTSPSLPMKIMIIADGIVGKEGKNTAKDCQPRPLPTSEEIEAHCQQVSETFAIALAVLRRLFSDNILKRHGISLVFLQCLGDAEAWMAVYAFLLKNTGVAIECVCRDSDIILLKQSAIDLILTVGKQPQVLYMTPEHALVNLNSMYDLKLGSIEELPLALVASFAMGTGDYCPTNAKTTGCGQQSVFKLLKKVLFESSIKPATFLSSELVMQLAQNMQRKSSNAHKDEVIRLLETQKWMEIFIRNSIKPIACMPRRPNQSLQMLDATARDHTQAFSQYDNGFFGVERSLYPVDATGFASPDRLRIIDMVCARVSNQAKKADDVIRMLHGSVVSIADDACMSALNAYMVASGSIPSLMSSMAMTSVSSSSSASSSSAATALTEPGLTTWDVIRVALRADLEAAAAKREQARPPAAAASGADGGQPTAAASAGSRSSCDLAQKVAEVQLLSSRACARVFLCVRDAPAGMQLMCCECLSVYLSAWNPDP